MRCEKYHMRCEKYHNHIITRKTCIIAFKWVEKGYALILREDLVLLYTKCYRIKSTVKLKFESCNFNTSDYFIKQIIHPVLDSSTMKEHMSSVF